MEQAGRKDMYMAVPEPGSHYEALAVDYGSVVRDFDTGAWSDGKNSTVVYQDCAIFDWRFSGG